MTELKSLIKLTREYNYITVIDEGFARSKIGKLVNKIINAGNKNNAT